jgi:hypothetical protein
MDPVRKLVSEGLQRQTHGPHPDPDLLSAFAEKALPERERGQILAHLGECVDCRQIVFFALPNSAEMQKVLAIEGRPRSSFALRWGTLTAAIVVCAVLLVATRHRGATSAYKLAVPAKAPGQIAADLKTPPELAEMRALRDDRATSKTNVTRQAEVDKVIPAPKHMTAKPAAKFDFDQSGQVRMAPRSDAAQTALQTEGRNFVDMEKLDAGAAASPQAARGAIGGLVQNRNTAVYSTSSGQGQGALAKMSLPAGNLGGTVLDPSGAVIPNATVTMVGPIGTRAAQSDPQGKFSFDRLVPGDYSVKAQAPGFKVAEIQQVAVLDKPLNLRLTLEPGNASEAVEVSAASPAVETTTAEIAQNEKQSDQLGRKKSAAANYRGAVAKTLSVAIPQWTLSPDGIVQRSADAGKTWQNVRVASGARFRALSSAGAHVWVGGSAGALYHSADSGQTWTRVVPDAAGRKLEADITHVDFADATNGTVTTASGDVWNTSDGGQTWQLP